MTAPLLIIGAGPVGMTLAMSLRRSGVDVRIVDKAAVRTDKSKALVIWPRTLELLDIQDCAQPFLEAGHPVIGARILAEAKVLAEIRLDTARSAYQAALIIPQSETERLLEEQLTVLGTAIERQVELKSFAADNGGITATLQHADGREELVHASYLIGCDGAHSVVRHGLGVEFEGETLPSDWVLADLLVDGPLPRNEITICWSPQGVLVFFPISGKRFRVIADVRPASGEVPPPTVPAVQRLLDERGPGDLFVHDPVWMSNFHINERKVRSYRLGRVFLCGDAAHVHSPAGGQGMNTGMQDAFNLAWKLALAWHERVSPTILDSYSPERSAIGEQVLRNAGRLTKVAILRNPLLQELRSFAVGSFGKIPALRQRMVDQFAELDLNYRGIGLTVNPPPHGASRRPAGGDRAPDLPLSSADTHASRLHQILRTGRFAILSIGAARVSLPESLKSLAVAAETGESDEYESGHIYLVRPDAYVMVSSKDGDSAPILEPLGRVAGQNTAAS
jgi:2-polyprenyl-6-methoxyphenol hydroxylase-like FAD-dependent oxidoreductase